MNKIIPSWCSYKEINEELKKSEYNDLEDMDFRMQVAYSELEDLLDVKYIATSINWYTLPPGMLKLVILNCCWSIYFPLR